MYSVGVGLGRSDPGNKCCYSMTAYYVAVLMSNTVHGLLHAFQSLFMLIASCRGRT